MNKATLDELENAVKQLMFAYDSSDDMPDCLSLIQKLRDDNVVKVKKQYPDIYQPINEIAKTFSNIFWNMGSPTIFSYLFEKDLTLIEILGYEIEII